LSISYLLLVPTPEVGAVPLGLGDIADGVDGIGRAVAERALLARVHLALSIAAPDRIARHRTEDDDDEREDGRGDSEPDGF
jgi:hypothetical protein